MGARYISGCLVGSDSKVKPSVLSHEKKRIKRRKKRRNLGSISCKPPPISNRVTPKFQLNHGIPRGDDCLGHSDCLGVDNHGKPPVPKHNSVPHSAKSALEKDQKDTSRGAFFFCRQEVALLHWTSSTCDKIGKGIHTHYFAHQLIVTADHQNWG